jgi:hypothetical protein
MLIKVFNLSQVLGAAQSFNLGIQGQFTAFLTAAG